MGRTVRVSIKMPARLIEGAKDCGPAGDATEVGPLRVKFESIDRVTFLNWS